MIATARPPARSAFVVLATRGTLLMLLWGIFAIRMPALVAVGIASGLLLLGFRLLTTAALDRLSVLVAVNIVYWLFSGFLCGALTPSTVLAASYYSNEGRIFVSYAVLVIASHCVVGRATLRLVVNQVALMAIAGVALYLLWAVARPGILSVGHARNFSGLLTSHTGSGTFFAELCIFLLIYAAHARSRLLLCVGAATLLPVLGSASRQSLLGLAVVLAWYLYRRLSLRTFVVGLVLVTGVVVSMPYVAPHTFERTAGLFDSATLRAIAAQAHAASTASWQPGQEKELEGEDVNVLGRIVYWAHALGQFRDSPFIGAGFGRFNDFNVHYSGPAGLARVGTSGQINPATLQAHNSYLHVLAETGLVGLVLLLTVWWQLWRRSTRALRTFRDTPWIAGYFEALRGMIVFLMAGALFGHALAAPIDAVPVLTLLGTGVAFCRRQQQAQRLTQVAAPLPSPSAIGAPRVATR